MTVVYGALKPSSYMYVYKTCKAWPLSFVVNESTLHDSTKYGMSDWLTDTIWMEWYMVSLYYFSHIGLTTVIISTDTLDDHNQTSVTIPELIWHDHISWSLWATGHDAHMESCLTSASQAYTLYDVYQRVSFSFVEE